MLYYIYHINIMRGTLLCRLIPDSRSTGYYVQRSFSWHMRRLYLRCI